MHAKAAVCLAHGPRPLCLAPLVPSPHLRAPRGDAPGVWRRRDHPNCHHGTESFAPDRRQGLSQRVRDRLEAAVGQERGLLNPSQQSTPAQLQAEPRAQGLLHRVDAARGHCISRPPRRVGFLETVCYFTSWPSCQAPSHLRTARQVQLRILPTAAFIAGISSRLGGLRPALPVPSAAISAGGRVHRLFPNPHHLRVDFGPQEWIWVPSTCTVSASRAQNGMNDKNNRDRIFVPGKCAVIPTCPCVSQEGRCEQRHLNPFS